MFEEQEQEAFIPQEPVFILCKISKIINNEVTDVVMAEVAVESGKQDTLAYLMLNPVENPKNKITTEFFTDIVSSTRFPISVRMGVLAEAALKSGFHLPIIDSRKDWDCRFVNKHNVMRFYYKNTESHEVYQIDFYKIYPYGYRLFAKIMNMLSWVENWSVILPNFPPTPPITITKKLKDVKPVVEVVTPIGSVWLNREEIFGILNWYYNHNSTRLNKLTPITGVYYPDIDKGKNIFFEITPSKVPVVKTNNGTEEEKDIQTARQQDYNQTYRTNIRIHKLYIKDENIFRLMMEVLNIATYSS